LPQPQETATPAPEDPQGSAPVVGDTDAGATAEQTQVGGQPTEATSPSQTDDEVVPEGLDSSTWAAMPKTERKKLNQYFTQRTQKVSAREKELEQTIAALNQAAQSLPQQPQAPPAPAEDALALQAIEQAFGPEVAQALDKLTQARVAPVRAELQQERATAHAGKLETEYQAFMHENPGAKALEPVMTQIAQTFRPHGMPMREYFDALHTLALKQSGQLEADITRRVTERITASGKAAEPPSAGVSPNRVTPTPPDLSKMSWSEALKAATDAAKRGERWNQ